MKSRPLNLSNNLRLVFYARLFALVAIAVGMSVLIGWEFDVALLKSVVPGKVAMRPNTAICFMLAGFALLLSSEIETGIFNLARKRTALVCSVLVSARPWI